MTKKVTRFAPVAAACAAAMMLGAAPSLNRADDIVQRTRAMYGDLRTYADTGVVVEEYGTSSADRHTFSTNFSRAPRRFVLDVRKQGGDRYVIWGDPDAFHTWWKTTGQVFDYANPDNAPAITSTGQSSLGTSGKVPTLLYSKAALAGSVSNFVDLVNDSPEVVNGHQCYRIRGRASDFYQTGRETNVHTTTVWIDTESLLIRKVLEEWTPLPGQRSRYITTYEPRANPTIDESRLRFTPPAK